MQSPYNPCRFAGPARRAGLWLAMLAPGGLAQDSTATSPTGSDALSPYAAGVQRLRYVVDMSPVTSSWGGAFLVAPVLKAPAELDPLFRTQMAGATAVSPDQSIDVTFPPASFARWSGAGVGVNPGANAAPSPSEAVTVSGFTRRFGIGVTGVSAGATNVITAVIGQRADAPGRLFVERVTALSSRATPSASDTATLTLGGVDHAGTAIIRADDATAKSTDSVRGDNLVRVVSAARNAGAAAALWWPPNETGTSTDPAAISYIASDLPVAVTTPALLPGAQAGAISLDFAARYLVNAAEQPGAGGLGAGPFRGNPTYAAAAGPLAGWPTSASGFVGVVARSATAPAAGVLNAFAVDAAGVVLPPARAAQPPAPLAGEGGFLINALGNAEFRHYRNQSLFRGPSGHVAVGLDAPTGTLALAAVLTDGPAAPGGPLGAEAVVICRMTLPEPTWSVIARAGTPILDGPGGVAVGSVAVGTPAVFSPPALDRLGNVYFVCAVQPAGTGPVAQALIKAVRTPGTPSGYTLERILQSGQTFTGVNSTRPWTITRLRLADSDSIDSGGFHAHALLQPVMPGASAASPADPRAFGGCVVNAVITYDAETPSQMQTYEATLLVAPAPAPPPSCTADLNGDGVVNTADLVAFLGRFGQSVTPGAPGDLNGDGQVNTIDLTRFLGAFGCGN